MHDDDGQELSFQERVQKALDEGLPIPDFPNVTPAQALSMAQADAVKNYEDAGFSRNEALYMTAAVFCGNPGMPPRT